MKTLRRIVRYGKRKPFELESIGADSQTRAWREHVFYERRLLEEIERRKLPGVYVDVGANLGNHFVFFWNYCPATEVIAIEPYAPNVEILKRNLKKNIFSYRIIERAVGSAAGKVRVGRIDDVACAAARIIPEKMETDRIRLRGVTDVQMETLDTLLAGVHQIAVIKLDVEGFEAAAVEGAREVIKQHHPLIIAECFRGGDFDQLNNLLVPMGYVTDGKNWCASRTCIWEFSGS